MFKFYLVFIRATRKLIANNFMPWEDYLPESLNELQQEMHRQCVVNWTLITNYYNSVFVTKMNFTLRGVANRTSYVLKWPFFFRLELVQQLFWFNVNTKRKSEKRYNTGRRNNSANFESIHLSRFGTQRMRHQEMDHFMGEIVLIFV